jgi:hypothetical protein
MATSAALNYALNNGIGLDQYNRNIINAYADAQTKGLSDAQIESTMNQYGVSAADVANAFRVPVAGVQSRLDVATPTTAAEIAFNKAAMDELAGREVKNQAQITANQAAYAEQQRLNNLAYAEQQRLNNLASAEQQRLNKIKSDAQIVANNAAYAEQQRLNNLKNQQQIATNQTAYEAYLANQAKLAAQQAVPTGATSVTGTMPFAGATQGFEQNFRNYTSIPIGAQYNPNVTAGGASPYSQVMSQMRPVGNPYAGVVAGQAMGGYNPALYDQIAAANVANTAAEQAATTAASAQQLDSSSTGGLAQGGMVHGGLMFGMNPPGPDDGAVNLDMGEYVIKKSSVNKYGRGLLDMINEGKVPAKKLKSLLG